MRKLLIISQVFLLIFGPIQGQVTWTADFSNGSFTTNPVWEGDTSYFIINNAQQLQLQAPGAGNAVLSTPSAISQQAEWEWWQEMTFNPSSSNFAAIHFMMDVSDSRLPHNGYFIRIGGSTERRIHLFRQDGTTTTLLAQSPENIVNTLNVTLRVRVTRDTAGTFQVYVDTQGGQQWQLIATATDSTHELSTHFGLYCQYTSTRADRFYFDDFTCTGIEVRDTIPPKLLQSRITTKEQQIVTFDKPLATVNLQQFERNQQPPDSLYHPLLNPSQVQLFYSTPFESESTYHFRMQQLSDQQGNLLLDTSWQQTCYFPEWNSIVFNEIMANPNPAVQLPDVEYLELYNTSNFAINLENWELQVGNQKRTLKNFELPSNGFVILYSENHHNAFPDSLPQMQLPLSSTSLTNAGQRLQLLTPNGDAIDSVAYSDQWYGDPNKRNGGWSLERIDPNRQCGAAQNWAASESTTGGTPAKRNSIAAPNPDTLSPRVIQYGLKTDDELWLIFNEPIKNISTTPKPYFIGQQIQIEPLTPTITRENEFAIHLLAPLEKRQVYALVIPSIFSDCHNNFNITDTLYFGIPEFPEEGDVLLNEILFNPGSAGVRFVELYNVSEKVLDLGQLRLNNASNGTIENVQEIAPSGTLFFPKTYKVITSNAEALWKSHPKTPHENTVASQLPSFSNTSGTIGVSTAALVLMDYLVYDQAMHHVSVKNYEGVSLERLRPSGPPNDPFNWSSAAATAGFATPGLPNSQLGSSAASEKRFEIVGSPFSPNGDGYRDLLEVHYKFNTSGYVLHARVYDTQGRQIAHFANNWLAGQTGVISWNGEADNGNIAPFGTYVLHIQAAHPDGSTFEFKGAFVLTF